MLRGDIKWQFFTAFCFSSGGLSCANSTAFTTRTLGAVRSWLLCAACLVTIGNLMWISNFIRQLHRILSGGLSRVSYGKVRLRLKWTWLRVWTTLLEGCPWCLSIWSMTRVNGRIEQSRIETRARPLSCNIWRGKKALWDELGMGLASLFCCVFSLKSFSLFLPSLS